MTQQELSEQITIVKKIVTDEMEKAVNIKGLSEEKFDSQVRMATVALLAVEVVGGLLMDIKRIADAGEKMQETLRSIDQG